MTLAREADPLPVVDAGRDLDVEASLLEDASRAAAGLARVLDDPAGASAARACLAADELAEGRFATRAGCGPCRSQSPHVEAVVPGCTPSPPHSAQGTATCTGTAALTPRAASSSEISIFGGDVGPACPARAGRDAEDVVPEERREDVGQAPEVERGRAKAAAAQAGVAEPVVELARLRLREHLVGLDDLLEPLVRVGLRSKRQGAARARAA